MKRLLLAAGLAALLTACLGPARPPTFPPPPLPVTGETPPPPPPVVSTGPAVAVLWTVAPGTDPLAAAQLLAAHPDLRLTVLLPEYFFGEDENAKKAKALFAEMVSQGRVELVLTLPNRPVLALIHDSDLAKLSTTTASSPLPPRFHRPEDVAGQIALARSAYRRRWKTPPAGLAVPWGVVVGPELESAARNFKWFYLGDKGAPGFCDAGGLPAVTAFPFPLKGDAASRRAWFRPRASSDSAPAPFRAASLEDVSALDALASEAGLRRVPVSEVVKGASPGAACGPSDLSPWIGQPEENRAWQLLGMTREAVEDFKNSGRADVQTLDRATREMYGAENGSVFFALGSEGARGRAGEVKREFLASLEQVYRFLGAPPPAALRQGFSGGALAEGGEAGSAEPFFRREGAALIWHDAAKDDRGPGDFFYPTGAAFPSGSWDLTQFRVEARADAVVFQWRLAALANPGQAPAGFSAELIDTYIDINHLPGAGAEELLPGRPGLVEPQNAWEYALSVDGWGARLYQQWSGGGQRRVALLPVKVVPPSTIEVSVPRKYLRGEPDGWGFAVAVMGRSADSPAGAEPSPMKVQAQPGPDNFGGALKGGAPAPFVDLLSDGTAQDEALSAYKQGRDAVLPFVRAEQ